MGEATVGAAPLEGIRVLDLSRWIAGPLCGMLLGDMGADVIKVERPGGEDVRTMAPLFRGESLFTMLYNRNKRAVTLNTRLDEGKALLEKLVSWSDILIENYRPGTMDKMGFGFERLQELSPGLILVSISGFGQTGPQRERPMFDAIAQALSGAMSLTGFPDSVPTMSATFPGDHTGALFATIGTLLALRHRERTGQGQVVDLALLDSMVSVLGPALPVYLNSGEVTQRQGNRDPVTAPTNTFATADGFIHLDAGSDALFARLAGAMGEAELATDPRFATVDQRMENVEELEKVVGSWFASRTIDEVSPVLEEAGIPFGPVADMRAVANNPQLQARQMFVSIEHPGTGTVTLPGLPIKLSLSPGAVRRHPPIVGEHNHEVYAEICGLSSDEIGDLQDQGVI